MTNRTKAKLIKWAYILGNLLIAVIFMLIVAVAKQTSTIIVAGILFLLFLGASVLIPLDFDLEDIILRRLLHNENLHKKTTEQMSDSERIQELEKSVGNLQKKLTSAKILAFSAIVFNLAICVYLLCFRS